MSGFVRVVLVEDEPLFRGLVAEVLRGRGDIEVVGEFGRAEAALARVPTLAPDVALLDIELGTGMTGVDLGLRLRESLPDLGIVLLSAHKDPAILTALPLEQASGWSYLLKQSVRDIDTLRTAVLGAAEGSITLDPTLTAVRHARPGGPLERLTPRQREILQLVAEGLSNAGIAERLTLAQKSVENHINALFAQLGIDSADKEIAPRVRAARVYLEATTAGR